MNKFSLNVVLFSILSLSANMVLAHDISLLETVGESQLSVAPDMASVNVEVMLYEETAAAAKAASDKAVVTFIDGLIAQGVTKGQISSANVQLQPKYNSPKDKAPEIVGYQASRNVTVEIKDLNKLNKLLDSAVTGDINKINNIVFKSSKAAELQKQVRTAAIENAKERAQALAQGFDAKLDGVWSIRYYPRMQAQPVMYKSLRLADNATSASYQYGQIQFSDSVEVSYKLKNEK